MYIYKGPRELSGSCSGFYSKRVVCSEALGTLNPQPPAMPAPHRPCRGYALDVCKLSTKRLTLTSRPLKLVFAQQHMTSEMV